MRLLLDTFAAILYTLDLIGLGWPAVCGQDSLGRAWTSPFLVISMWTSPVCLSVMDRQLTTNPLPALILHVLHHVLIQNHSRVEDMNHGQSNSSMAITRTETTHGLTYSVARVIDITAWQSVNTFCLCCLTHGVCVSMVFCQWLIFNPTIIKTSSTSHSHTKTQCVFHLTLDTWLGQILSALYILC